MFRPDQALVYFSVYVTRDPAWTPEVRDKVGSERSDPEGRAPLARGRGDQPQATGSSGFVFPVGFQGRAATGRTWLGACRPPGATGLAPFLKFSVLVWGANGKHAESAQH